MTKVISSSDETTSPQEQQNQDEEELDRQMSKLKANDDDIVTSDTNNTAATTSEDVVIFPVDDLERLDEMLGRARWIVPVLPKSELETLLDAAIALCKRKEDTNSEHCQRFFKDGLTISFIRILTDDAVNTWKYDIYKHIYNNTLKAVELCTLKLLDDWYPLLDLLALIYNPQCRYHIVNSMRVSDLSIRVNLKKTSPNKKTSTVVRRARRVQRANELASDVVNSEQDDETMASEEEIFAEESKNDEIRQDKEDSECSADISDQENEEQEDAEMLIKKGSDNEDSSPRVSKIRQKKLAKQDRLNSSSTTYAKSYSKAPYGWLVDFINYFGQLNGFDRLLERFTNNVKLTIPLIASLLKPWGLCYQFLTPYTIKTYFLPIIDLVPKFFENLSDEDIKKECKSESKNDSISTVIKWLKLLATRVQNQEETCKSLEILRLKTILRILKFASFNGKMNALNEVNKVISNITYNVQVKSATVGISGTASTSSLSRVDCGDEEWLTSDRLAKWIQENDVLDIVLRDCMHQPQYVEKLEKILRFLLKEKALSLRDLDKIWESQAGKHEAIVKNVHDLLSKLAWDFTPEQLDHLFSCFQTSWTNASRKQREKLLDLIRSLSEDDKEGVMANKVLDLLWNLAHSEDAPTEIIDQAVNAHIKILDFSCSADKELQKLKYLEKCIEQVRENKWVVVSLRQIREILQQYPEILSGSFHTHRLLNYQQQSQTSSSLLLSSNNQLLTSSSGIGTGSSPSSTTSSSMLANNCCYTRPDMIAKLQKEHSLIIMITNNLANYHEQTKKLVSSTTSNSDEALITDPETLLVDGRFAHSTQIQERLNSLKYLLKEGQLMLSSEQAETIWNCLAQTSTFDIDREICFKWFSKLFMCDEPFLDSDTVKSFFVNLVTKLDPKQLTESGIRCFDRFFKHVNLKCQRIRQKGNTFQTESLDLIGLDYLWKIVTFANEDIVEKAILLLKHTYINLGPALKQEQRAIHADLISNCMDRLRVSYDNLSILTKQNVDCDEQQKKLDDIKISQEITQVLRVMIVLREYINEFDSTYFYERLHAPFYRASKGKSLTLVIRMQMQNKPPTAAGNNSDEFELVSHVNDTIGSLRRQIYLKTKLSPQVNRIELIINNEPVECVEDNKILGDYHVREKMIIIARVTPTTPPTLNSSLTGVGGSNSSSSNVNTSKLATSSGNNVDSSVDSSSDEVEETNTASSGDELHHVIHAPNLEYELNLPSVILSLNDSYVNFLLDLVDFGCSLKNVQIRECTRGILDMLPIAKHISEKLRSICKETTSAEKEDRLDKVYTSCSPTQCWYYLKATHALLVPAVSINSEETKQFQESFIVAGGIGCFKRLLVDESFMQTADDNTKKAAYLYVLKINKLTMTIVCHAIYSYVLNAIQSKQYSLISEEQHSHALLLQNSVNAIPSGVNEATIRSLGQRLGQQFSQFLINESLELKHIIRLERIAWSLAASFSLDLINAPSHEKFHDSLITNASSTSSNSIDCHHNHHNQSNSTSSMSHVSHHQTELSYDVNACREALECLSLSLCLVPNALEALNQEKHWRTFIIDLLLHCSNRLIRQTASEQFLLIALKCSLNPNKPIQFFIQMLFTWLHNLNNSKSSGGPNTTSHCQEYFYLLCRLLNCACINQVKISNADALLNNEINWIRRMKQVYLDTQSSIEKKESSSSSGEIDELLLEGHLSITKELLQFQTSEKKQTIGGSIQSGLIVDLIEYFIFPSSCLFKKYRDVLATNSNIEQILSNSMRLKAICQTSSTLSTAFDLLVALSTGCLANFNLLNELLFQLFYPSLLSNNSSDGDEELNSSFSSTMLSNDCTIPSTEWEYLPPIGQRPHNGFVGLKNAGATCYMNSVLQQLFMIKEIRNSILSIDIPQSSLPSHQKDTSSDLLEELSDSENHYSLLSRSNTSNNNPNNSMSEEDQRKDYNMSIFRCLQMIYGHLGESKMQYYVPKAFWRHFRFGSGGERVNLREQHDAVEFLNSIVDCIDETMKSLKLEQTCARVLGGTFADQKICKGCPHRYSRDESFTLLSVDIKHCQRLTESLEQYVKGDLLEGPNAYHCEKCNKKIDAVKRTCIRKLPPVLAIQLKRFDYDWEREIAVKSNEYFEFPRELDMEPYTVRGVAQLEREQQKQQQKQLQQQQQNLNTSGLSETSSSIPKLDNLEGQTDFDYDDEDADDLNSTEYTTLYKLVGIVVHSGQANGGHYYSFIKNRSPGLDNPTDSADTMSMASENAGGQYNNWFKFDDNDVSEFKLDDEELRNQCYGGDYTGEVYDNVMKRLTYKKQKRWWNAYILFYERVKQKDAQVSNRQDSRSTTPRQQNQHHQQTSRKNSCSMETCGEKQRSLSQSSSSSQHQLPVKMPLYVVKSVLKKNIRFLHQRNHFSLEYFHFMKKLIQANLFYCQQNESNLQSDEVEELCLASVKFAFKFLFNVGLRLKKNLRGQINDCYEALFTYAKYSYKARQWMLHYLLVENSVIFAQYFLDCPVNEIRGFISKCLVALVHLSYNDPGVELKLNTLLSVRNHQQILSILVTTPDQANASPTKSSASLINLQSLVVNTVNSTLSNQPEAFKSYKINQSDSVITTLLSLLSKREIINDQTGKNLIQYFQFFSYYLSLGLQQCLHLIRCDTPLVFIQFAVDELPSFSSTTGMINSISSSFASSQFRLSSQTSGSGGAASQHVDLAKLYCVVSVLIRCYDVSSYCSSAIDSESVAVNPYSHLTELKQQEGANFNPHGLNTHLKLPAKLAELIYKQTSFVKKLLDDGPSMDETVKLVKFLSWENFSFSLVLLNELLWMTAYHYTYELKPHLELVYHMLTLSDSWQTKRVLIALKGVPNERDGLFEVIAKSQNHYQKRAYQIIKMLVHLFSSSQLALDVLNNDDELKQYWRKSREWFQAEMEKCMMYDMRTYGYYQTPQSNETSQTYYLERTQSARLTLERAMQICPSQGDSADTEGSNHHQTPNESPISASITTPITTNHNRSSLIKKIGKKNQDDDEDDVEDDEDEEEEEEDAYESISDEDNVEYDVAEHKTKPE